MEYYYTRIRIQLEKDLKETRYNIERETSIVLHDLNQRYCSCILYRTPFKVWKDVVAWRTALLPAIMK